MALATALEDLGFLVVVALVPALGYLAWVRKSERYRVEGWGTLLGGFAYGALFATVAAGFLEVLAVGIGTAVSQQYPGPEFVFLNGNSTAGAFFLVLVLAPLIEEALKASGVVGRKSALRHVADGPVVGASVGLGFGFFETFLYGVGAFLVGGLVAGLTLIVLRSISSVLLHGSTTAMFGYGYARSRFGVVGAGSGSYYLLAVGMHAAFNALASVGVILALVGIGGVAAEAGAVIALFAGIAFAIGAIEHVRAVVQTADYPALRPGPRGMPGTRPPGR